VALLLGIGVATATAGVVPEALYDKAAREGSVRVIVQLRVTTTLEGKLQSAAAVASQRQDIAAMRGAALAELAGTSHRTVREFATIPFVALEVAPDALSTLEASPNVVGVEEDRLESVALSQSVPLIGADQAWAAGFDGTGIVVAILDTGVDNTHPFLSGKVVEEACYSSNGNCPNGLTSQTGPGAGVPCTYAPDGCSHGTHVAGIATGSGASAGVSFSGVAKGAGIIAVQVFSRFTGSTCTGEGEDPCAKTFISDQIAGLERVFVLRTTHSIAAVNMSLGGSTKFTSPCDSSEAMRKAAIDNLRSVGIVTVIASGNEGFTDGLGAPACISTAVSVGNTTKSDAVSSSSNSATFLSLLAPGSSVNSSVPGGGFGLKSGTSMATPHVAGAWAILKQKKPTATVNEVLTALTSTGLPITDARNGITKPRIRVDQALQAVTTSRLTNISTRGRVETGDNVMIGGFIIGGTTPKTVLVQAIGPAMTAAGVPGVLADPVLQLFSGGTPIAQNDDWQVTQPLCQQSGHTCGGPTEIAATGLAPSHPLESALLITLPPGAYTAIVSGFAGTTGVGLVAVYEVDSAAATRLTNISTRGRVETGDNVMIGGFIIGGTTPKTVLVQAIGPAMTAAGVPGVLADPVLQLFSGGTPIAQNDDWQVTQPLCQQSGHTCGGPTEIAATGLAPSHPLESALLITLPPGAYTAIVSGFAGTTGVGLVAVYEVADQ
jgi:subtilisin family serine protease